MLKKTIIRDFSKNLLLFLIPLIIRTIPELQTPYLVGWDTPDYAYRAFLIKGNPMLWLNPFYALLGIFTTLGLSSSAVMKAYPPISFALLITLLTIYAKKVLNLTSYRTLIIALILSLCPAILRISWDLHRQNFALILLSILILLHPAKKLNKVLIFILTILIGMTNELVFAILVSIFVYRSFMNIVSKKYKIAGYYITLVSLPFIGYAILCVIYGGEFFNLLSLIFVKGYEPTLWQIAYYPQTKLDWWLSLLLISFGPLLPLAALGYFKDDSLTPWLGFTSLAYASYIMPFGISFNFSFNLVERWILLASIPLTLYASIPILKARNYLKAFVAIGLISIQALSMLGAFGYPLMIFKNETYGIFVDSLKPSLPDQTILGLKDISRWLEKHAPDSILLAYPDLIPHLRYISKGKLNIVDTNELEAINIVKKYSNGTLQKDVYYLWFKYAGRPPQIYREGMAIKVKPVYKVFPILEVRYYWYPIEPRMEKPSNLPFELKKVMEKPTLLLYKFERKG